MCRVSVRVIVRLKVRVSVRVPARVRFRVSVSVSVRVTVSVTACVRVTFRIYLKGTCLNPFEHLVCSMATCERMGVRGRVQGFGFGLEFRLGV